MRASFLALLATVAAMGPVPLTRESAIDEARKLVAQERALASGSLEVDLAVAETWPDAGLGCPEKGHVYAQVLSEGFRVVLRHDTDRFDVRVAPGRSVLCGPRTARTVAPSDLRAADKVQRLAKADLAQRLGVTPDTVRVEFLKTTTWPDAGLGCPGSAAAEPKPTPGFELRLSHGQDRFSYHADHERVALCEPRKD
jgi:hypothetical protein